MNREDLLRPGETIKKMNTNGWIVPASQLPLGTDLIVDWPWSPSDQMADPFRCTVDGHFFNGTVRVTWPESWPRQEHRDTVNLGDDCWWSIWIVESPK